MSQECNSILRVPPSFPRTGAPGRAGACLVTGKAATCGSQQKSSSDTGLLGHNKVM